MKFKQKRLVSYASTFVSYLIRKLSKKQFEIMKSVYLFGSVSRGDFNKRSDVDIFVEAEREFKNLDKIKESFYKTIWFKRWKQLGVSNEINTLSGKLSDWKLESSIKSDGILLFSSSKPPNLEKWSLISWSPPKQVKRRVKLHRDLFGYWGKKKRYKGLIDKKGWKRVGSTAVLIREAEQVLNILHRLKVQYEIKDIYLTS